MISPKTNFGGEVAVAVAVAIQGQMLRHVRTTRNLRV
jgi:hypothetical protein